MLHTSGISMRTELRSRGCGRSAILGALLASMIAACSAGSDKGTVFQPGKGGQTATPEEKGGGGGNQGGGGGGSSSVSGAGGSKALVSVGQREEPADAGDPSQVQADAACASDTQQAAMLPVKMFIQFDRSSSMSQAGVGATEVKWAQASSALDAFFKEPGSAGLEIALHFFPSDRPACGCQGSVNMVSGTEGECNVEACGQPLVPLGALTEESGDSDPQEKALVEAVDGTSPPQVATGIGGIGGIGGATTSTCAPQGEDRAIGTPIAAALDGAIRWAVTNQAETATEAKWVVVIVTDGEPHGCGTAEQIVQLAKDAQTKGILVYSIGMDGADTNVMNRIAAAGGTKKAFVVTGAGGQQQLIAALDAIRGNAISCDISFKDTRNVDENKVNVTFTPSTDGSDPVFFYRVPDSGACGDGNGWYFADSTNKRLTLCPSSCKLAQADNKGKLDVLLGCQTFTAPPN